MWIKANEHSSNFSQETDASGITARASVQYLHGEVAGRYLQTLEVEDLSVPDDRVVKSLLLPWSTSEFS